MLNRRQFLLWKNYLWRIILFAARIYWRANMSLRIIFSAQPQKSYVKGCHENARRNSSHSTSVIVPFSVDTQGNFCSVAILFLKSMAKLKFKDMPGDKRMKDLAQSNWVSETCRNIQVQVIKTTAFNNRLALKSSFGMDYNKLFPGSIFNPPSYSENFISSSSEGWPIYLY